MDYCKERGVVYVSLIDEVNTAGFPRDKDNNSICGAEGGLKSPARITVHTFLCGFSNFYLKKEIKGKQEWEDVFSVAH